MYTENTDVKMNCMYIAYMLEDIVHIRVT